MEEEWKSIEGWPDYMISNLGRVYSIRRDIMLKTGLTNNGHYTVDLWMNNLRIRHYVHRLVGEAFVDGWFEGAEINHKNGVKANNVFCNLEWVTHGDNIRHAYETGLIQRRPVRIVETNEVFESAADCAAYIDGQDSHISNCLRGKRLTHKGYTFEYVD